MTRKLLVGAIAAGALAVTAGTAFALTDNGATAPSSAAGLPTSFTTSNDDTPTPSSPTSLAPSGTESTGAELSADDAAGIALARYGGTVREVEREMEHGRMEWKVEVTAADGTEYDVRLDARTGAVTRVDQDDHGRHGDDDHGGGEDG
jgi:hypothetical protein